MKALITGGTSGIGLAMARELLNRDYEVILISRTKGDIDELFKDYSKDKISFSSYDLSKEDECYRLVRDYEDTEIDVFINNAGFGDIGRIEKTSLEKEINMIKVNDLAAFILGKSFLLKMIKQNHGRVLFVASAAAFGVAPYMNVYYATKAFVYSLAHGYYRELKDMKSKVSVSVLCPGPVKTRFEETANAKFTISSMTKEKCAKIAVKGLLKGKFEIVPGLSIKAAHLFSHFVPKKWIAKLLRKQSEIKE